MHCQIKPLPSVSLKRASLIDYNHIFDQLPTYPSEPYHDLVNESWRKKRETGEKLNETRAEKVLQRSKREIPGNPCVIGKEKRTVIFYALDAEYEIARELLQDAGE